LFPLLMGKRMRVQGIHDDVLVFEIGMEGLDIFKIAVDLLDPGHVLEKIAVLASRLSGFHCFSHIFFCAGFPILFPVILCQKGYKRETGKPGHRFHDMANEIEFKKIPLVAEMFPVHKRSLNFHMNP